MGYSERYLKFKDEFKKKIEFIEINLGKKHKDIYKTLPGEDRYRWNHESIVYSGIFSNISSIPQETKSLDIHPAGYNRYLHFSKLLPIITHLISYSDNLII